MGGKSDKKSIAPKRILQKKTQNKAAALPKIQAKMSGKGK